MRRTNKLDYIILALTCLVALNLGAITLGLHSSKESDNVDKRQFKISNIVNISNISFDPVKKAIDSLFPIAKILNGGEDSLETGIVPSEDEEPVENVNEEHDAYADIIINLSYGI